jgi:hypothetical protein
LNNSKDTVVTPYAICNLTEADIVIAKEASPQELALMNEYETKKRNKALK